MTSRCPSSRPTAAGAAERFRDLATARLLPPRQDLPDPAVDEAARLATVRRYQILDTPPEDVFDDVTALAAQILHAPTALVAITDRDRIWFKSRHDFTEPEIDRNTGLGELLHSGTRPWTIHDTTSGSRTSSAPHREEPRARGIAAAPLRTHDGHTIGALCVLDPAPHDFTTEDLTLLARLAAVVIRELELRLACRRAVFNRRAPDPDPVPVAGGTPLNAPPGDRHHDVRPRSSTSGRAPRRES